MNKTIAILIPLLLASCFLCAQNTAVLHSDSVKQTISRHIYGHFAEHLGKGIYGGFYVGEKNTKIPHTNGVRNDVVTALKRLKVPNLRWPGGCFADTYHWKDGIGPKEARPTIVNTWWGGVTEDNSFGTHDFLNLCRMLEAEPYLAANVGSGTVQELIDWVQYVNFDGRAPMSDLRRQNGQEKPWNVTYWGVGNEPWGCGGNMTAEYYANLYRQYATYMTGFSGAGNMFRIASGPAGDDYRWTEVLMKNIPHSMMNGIALHYYAVIDWSAKGPAKDFTEQHYFTSMQRAWKMDEILKGHKAVMDKYDPQKKIALVVDEWGGWYDVEPGTNPGFLYQQNTMRDAMIAGMTLNVFNNHSDRVRMANLAQAINVLQAVIFTSEEKMLLTPTYHVMEMYNVHQDAQLLPLDLASGEYALGEQKLPAVSGSASVNKAGQTHITLTNIHAAKSQQLSIDLKGKSYKTVSGRILASEKLQDHNTFDQPQKVKPVSFKGATLKGGNLQVVLPPFSVVVLELK